MLISNFLLEQVKVEVIEGISDHNIPMCILPLDYKIWVQTTAQTIINFDKADDAHEFQAISALASDPLTDVNVVCVRFKDSLFLLNRKKKNWKINRALLGKYIQNANSKGYAELARQQAMTHLTHLG